VISNCYSAKAVKTAELIDCVASTSLEQNPTPAVWRDRLDIFVFFQLKFRNRRSILNFGMPNEQRGRGN
jgi:hypothetical protein